MNGEREAPKPRAPSKARVRLQEVALEAGYSIGTVSRALSSPGTLAPATVARVRAVAERLGYRPNIMARALKTGSSHSIYVICPRISCFFPEIIRGIEAAAVDFGYSILIVLTGRDPEQEDRYLAEITAGRADGALLLSTPRLDQKLAEMEKCPPVVSVMDGMAHHGIPAVRIDHAQGARQAVEYLASLGHRRIAHITGNLDVSLARERKHGYAEAMRLVGLQPVCVQGMFTAEAGQAAMTELLGRPDRPTAVFAGNDEVAAGALAAIRHAGLRVPQDISVIGHDNQVLSRIYDPQITTIDVPAYEVGYQAMRVLSARLHREAYAQDTLLPTQVLERETTAYVAK